MYSSPVAASLPACHPEPTPAQLQQKCLPREQSPFTIRQAPHPPEDHSDSPGTGLTWQVLMSLASHFAPGKKSMQRQMGTVYPLRAVIFSRPLLGRLSSLSCHQSSFQLSYHFLREAVSIRANPAMWRFYGTSGLLL